MAKKKYYAVKIGKNPGIYLSWDECKEQVSGYPKAEYKGFPTEEEAKTYLGIIEEKSELLSYDKAVVYVDGSFNKDTNLYGSGIVFIAEGEYKEFSFHGNEENMLKMWSVAGEVCAAMKAVQYAIENNYKEITIYYDYNGIEGFVDGCILNGKRTKIWKAEKEGAKEYKKFMLDAKGKIDIHFVKVSAHTGNKYNEKADELANKATQITENKKED